MRHNNRRSSFRIPKRLTSQSTLAALSLIATSPDNSYMIKSRIYKGIYSQNGSEIHETRETLKKIYFQKCAYCENKEHTPEVEHYRPKGAVAEDTTHRGYYWLCYEWTNMLPSCHSCNAETGKRNQFPILGTRVFTPSFFSNNKLDSHIESQLLISEQPYLLHPEIDHPDSGMYFQFSNNGMIEGIDSQGRGEKTIAICNLNRQNLLELRQRLIIDDLLFFIRTGLDVFLQGQVLNEERLNIYLIPIFQRLKEKREPKEPFSLMAIYVYEHFDELIVPLMPTPEQGEAISAAFANFKTAHPD